MNLCFSSFNDGWVSPQEIKVLWLVSRIAIRDFVIYRICVVSKVTANVGFCILMQTLFKIYFRTRVITSKRRTLEWDHKVLVIWCIPVVFIIQHCGFGQWYFEPIITIYSWFMRWFDRKKCASIQSAYIANHVELVVQSNVPPIHPSGIQCQLNLVVQLKILWCYQDLCKMHTYWIIISRF